MLDDEYLDGKICPYCREDTEYVDSKKVYGKSYGMIYLCKGCDAYVGVHDGTDVALGRLADKELRFWKKEAHRYFDPLWKKKAEKGYSKNKARRSGYMWLSKQLGIKPKRTHIGMMTVDECKKIVELCKKYYIN